MIFINGNRNGYSPEQCGTTMTMGELVAYLQDFGDEEELVYLCNDNGYTYGSITRRDFSQKEELEDDGNDE